MHRFLSVRLLLLAGLPAIVFIATLTLGTQLAGTHEKAAISAGKHAFHALIDGTARRLHAEFEALTRDVARASDDLLAAWDPEADAARAPALLALLAHQPSLAVATVHGPDGLPAYASLRPFDRKDPLRRSGLPFPPTSTHPLPHWRFDRIASDEALLVRHALSTDATGTPRLRLTVTLGARDLDALLRRLHPGPDSTWLLTGPDEHLVALTKTPNPSDDDSPRVAGMLIREPSVQALLDRRERPADGMEGVHTLKLGGEHFLGRLVPLQVGEVPLSLGAVAPRAAFTGPLELDTRDTVRRALLFALMAAVLAFVVARTITGPLADVASELEHVAAMAPDPPRAEPRFREFATIQDAVDHVRRSQRSFMSYVPREVVRAIGTSGRAARLEGETRVLTILFSDAAGFTQWAADRKPEELVVELGRYLTQVCDEVVKQEGTVDKFLGDGVVAFWGAPKQQPDHAFRAVSAALAAHKRLSARADREFLDTTAFPTRFGLATGPVLVGNIGTPDRLNYTILGDTANYASRLEPLNKRYGSAILVSETTATAVLDRVILRPVDIVTVQGRSRAERIYQPLGLIDDPEASHFEDIAQLATDGLNRYLNRDFANAAEQYARILASDPHDGPARVLLERCRKYQKTGVPHGWDGVEHTTK